METIKRLWRAFLGSHSWAPAGQVDPNKLWGGVRTGLMVVAASCLTHAHGFGPFAIVGCIFSGLSASWWLAVLVGVVDFIRRLQKDYSASARIAVVAAQQTTEVSDAESL